LGDFEANWGVVYKNVEFMEGVGRKIKVIAATPEEKLEWRNLPVSLAVGLESGLIEKFRPEWNLLNKRIAVTRPATL
jgi:hypothetical protein